MNRLVEIGAGIAGEAVEEELQQQRLARIEFAVGGPGEADIAGLILVLEREIDDPNATRRGRARGGEECLRSPL